MGANGAMYDGKQEGQPSVPSWSDSSGVAYWSRRFRDPVQSDQTCLILGHFGPLVLRPVWSSFVTRLTATTSDRKSVTVVFLRFAFS